MRVAALDLGSNTFLCLIADINENGGITIVSDSAEVVRLGQGLAVTGKISAEALQRANDCLVKFQAQINLHKPERIMAVATAAARTAQNKNELVNCLENFNIPLEIISGDREAELTFKGGISARTGSSLKLIIDIGGGSTELIIGSSKGILWKRSFEVGVVKLQEKFVNKFPMNSETHRMIENEINQILDPDLIDPQGLAQSGSLEIIAVAGTPTTLAAMVLGEFDINKIEVFQFSLQELEIWKNRLAALTPSEIEKEFGAPKGRSDVIAIGVMILVSVMKRLQRNQLIVSTRGLRFGVAAALAENEFANA